MSDNRFVSRSSMHCHPTVPHPGENPAEQLERGRLSSVATNLSKLSGNYRISQLRRLNAALNSSANPRQAGG